MRLNIGGGDHEIPGYENVDRKHGKEAYPLPYEDNSIEVIRASHILEHFSHRQVAPVLKEWVRVLEPGGWLRVAVPDFNWIVHAYQEGHDVPIQGYLMGGQVDEDDYHKTIFDRGGLERELEMAGLVDIQGWRDDVGDCASLEVSLNLMGRKPTQQDIEERGRPVPWEEIIEQARKVGAAMSVPRLGFMDNFFGAFQLAQMGIGIRKHTGAFWGQCLQRTLEGWVEDGKEWILTIDYDSVFNKEDVGGLIALSLEHPEADAIAPIQAHRTKSTPLMTVRGEDGRNITTIPFDEFKKPLMKVATAHFGLTLIKTEALLKVPKPWFWSTPDEKGQWSDAARVDDDIWFWRRWEEAGNTLYLANRVTVGHAELMVRWPGPDMKAGYQHPSEFWDKGRPRWVWK